MTRILSDRKEWSFLTSGNANLVFEYCGDDELYKGKVLRLRKASQAITTKEVYEFMTTVIAEILDHVVPTEIVRVNFKSEGALNDGYGLLLPNLLSGTQVIRMEKYFTVHEGHHLSILEIKPKWLTTTRLGCRNCAHHKYKHGTESTFCSKNLLRREGIDHIAKHIVDNKTTQIALQEYLLQDDNVFQQLRRLQRNDFNFDGIDSIDMISGEHCLQMTLRDVTVFLKVHNGRVTDVNITDVDPKSREKWVHWAKTGRILEELCYSSKVNCASTNILPS